MEKTQQQIQLLQLQKRITRLFNKACADYSLIQDGDHILIGLSGGKDSLALTQLLAARQKIYVPRFHVTAAFISIDNIGYQADTLYLQQFCEQHGVDFIQRQTHFDYDPALKQHKNTCFLCSWYRRKALFDLAEELHCNKIALGHHKDDIVETLLLNLIFQGTIATMPPLLKMDKFPMQIIRPLSLIDEQTLQRFAQLQGYRKTPKNCPFEKDTNRAVIKDLITNLQKLNPNVRDSIYSAMENIKPLYLPQKK